MAASWGNCFSWYCRIRPLGSWRICHLFVSTHEPCCFFLPKLVAALLSKIFVPFSETSSSFSLRHSSALHFVFGRKMFRSCPALAGGVGETKVVVVARQLLIPLSGSQTKNAEGLTIRAFGTMLGKGSRCWHEMLKGDSKVTRSFNWAQLRLWMKLKHGDLIFSDEFALRSFNKSYGCSMWSSGASQCVELWRSVLSVGSCYLLWWSGVTNMFCQSSRS